MPFNGSAMEQSMLLDLCNALLMARVHRKDLLLMALNRVEDLGLPLGMQREDVDFSEAYREVISDLHTAYNRGFLEQEVVYLKERLR